MSAAGLSPSKLCSMMIYVAEALIAKAEVLDAADRMGDGDHGSGMRRGFEGVRAALRAIEPDSPSAVLDAVGRSLMMKAGGAAGAVFGTLFRAGAKALAGEVAFDSGALSRFLCAGALAVAARGKASVGEKSMLDALDPAAKEAAHAAGGSLGEALDRAAAQAAAGAERTKEMVARVGKAKTLGERSRGHEDPGALSVSFILRAMAEYAASHR